VPRRAIQKIAATYDLGDSLRGIVHDDREVIRKGAVTASNHEITAVGGHVLNKQTLDSIQEFNCPGLDA
jgi:hypothetical protein